MWSGKIDKPGTFPPALWTLKNHTGWVRSVAFVPAGATRSLRFVSASGDKTLKVWDVKGGRHGEVPHRLGHRKNKNFHIFSVFLTLHVGNFTTLIILLLLETTYLSHV